MMNSYTPTYYTTFQDSIASLCKSILPFSFKKRRLPAIAAAEQRLSKQQSDNLKWQQESFHQILNLMGLSKEGILPESEVSAFRSSLLETLTASPMDHEQPSILRDKLIFLQELLYAKCISEEEYHSSKRPLLQRLAVQGAEIKARDVIAGVKKEAPKGGWSVIDLKDDEQNMAGEEKNKAKAGSAAIKQIKGAASVFSFVSSASSSHKSGRANEDNAASSSTSNELGLSRENPFWNVHLKDVESERESILMSESLPPDSFRVEKKQNGDNSKRKHGCDGGDQGSLKSGKKQWGFEGLMKWRKSNAEDKTVASSVNSKANVKNDSGQEAESPPGNKPENKNTKQINRKMDPNGSPSDFHKDLGENVKRELYMIQADFNAKNPDIQFSDYQIEVISTRLPVDRADLKKFFPKSWRDRYGDVVLDVVRKEFKGHGGGESGGSLQAVIENCSKSGNNGWVTFEEDENCHPNLFAQNNNQTLTTKQAKLTQPLKDDQCRITDSSTTSTVKYFKYNPFFDSNYVKKT